jgi:hypothetical protein
MERDVKRAALRIVALMMAKVDDGAYFKRFDPREDGDFEIYFDGHLQMSEIEAAIRG